MIVEVVTINTEAHRAAEFEATLHAAVATCISPARGFIAYVLERCIEKQGCYALRIKWQTLENHTVDFRGSEAFTRWREQVGPFFTIPPMVVHFHEV